MFLKVSVRQSNASREAWVHVRQGERMRGWIK